MYENSTTGDMYGGVDYSLQMTVEAVDGYVFDEETEYCLTNPVVEKGLKEERN